MHQVTMMAKVADHNEERSNFRPCARTHLHQIGRAAADSNDANESRQHNFNISAGVIELGPSVWHSTMCGEHERRLI